ncbi:hypothetical protein OAG69_00255 [bacterium]|nr:hypothetical protein [bacterium]
MDIETVDEMRSILAAHANACRCNAAIEKMKVANVEARSQGEDDPYDATSFEEIEAELKEYAEELAN